MNFTFLEQLVKEVSFKTSRSEGKGGQNVNKVATKVELLFNIKASKVLSAEQKQTIAEKLKNRIDIDGVLHLIAQTERSQLANKEIVVKKFVELLKKALTKPILRKPTKPSKAAKAKRLDVKKHRSEIKKGRRGGFI
ncbi:MAG: aminoacyl-tRNA hydrolase [Bacteroidetes bacterium]|nr:aminoacyl-tRNA hydrolase [Bacteroidota bacterium]